MSFVCVKSFAEAAERRDFRGMVKLAQSKGALQALADASGVKVGTLIQVGRCHNRLSKNQQRKLIAACASPSLIAL